MESSITKNLEKDSFENTQIARILTKLAIQHSTYGVSEGFTIAYSSTTFNSALVSYNFFINMTHAEIEHFSSFFNIT